ncbi:MAG: peptidoglycan DD-metalloendopeptidase family protein [Alphaproteobacteria bacterium]|nr:peptidoglycan DD-metalloendopeptidase family protein [Alphaproteobacteria bacterium]MCY4320464.1 peptidoglycan DD-metalloendopeptidase family protein [Alphaproteobacteria bacterium]
MSNRPNHTVDRRVLFLALFPLLFPTATAQAAETTEVPPLPVPSPAAAGPDRQAPVVMLHPKLPLPPRLVFEPGINEPAVEHVFRIRKGQSLMAVLTGAGINAGDAHDAAEELARVMDLRRLKVGETVTVTLAGGKAGGAAGALSGLRMKKDIRTEVGVGRLLDGSLQSFERQRRLRREPISIQGEIASSLYADGVKQGAPAAVMLEVFRLFSYSVDLQRDIHRGDRFALLFDRYREVDGVDADYGEVEYAALDTGGEKIRFYRFETEPGTFAYFDAEGQGVRRALLATPLDSARITSSFGRRRHPILGYSMMHRGVDFGAPTGTPIRAAGDGTVVSRGWKGAYGRYIRIRHRGGYQTAYAHLSRYAKGLRQGGRVKQGEVIGYVGSSGRSTGPHLHYEVIVNGRQVNPVTLKLPSNQSLADEALERFRLHRNEIDRKLQEMAGSQRADAGISAVN